MTSGRARFLWLPAFLHEAAPKARQRRLSDFARIVGCMLLLGLAASGAQAMSIRELRTLEANEKEGKLFANYYLVGVMEGLREASDTALREHQKAAFCIEGRKIEPAMARSLYQTELGRNADSYEADMPVQLVLLSALRTSYRCTH